MTAMEIREMKYPNGHECSQVYAGKVLLGSYTKEDGGFLPWGCRKPLKEERDAQIKVIQRYISARLKEAANAAALYKEFDGEEQGE